MISFILLTVFVAGLMIGRTPEYLGKNIGIFEMKMVSIILITPVILSLGATGVASIWSQTNGTVFNPGPQGFSEMLYAVSSASNNNGSTMTGLNLNTPSWNYLLGLCMLLSRISFLIPMLAIAGSLAIKKPSPPSRGTLNVSSVTFIVFLCLVILLFGILTYVPALALGPVAEHFHLQSLARGSP
jgi:K+-transporting ATPase ATPase A chain